MEWHSRTPAVGMAELLVSPTLPDLDAPQRFQPGDNLLRLEHRQLRHGQSTCTACVPTNCDSNSGSPSSRSIPMTSARFRFNSSSVSPWEWAPGKPGTYPTKSPVSEQRS